MPKNEWKKIGEVGVDSGGLMVTDPCYVSSWKDDGCGDIAPRFKDVETGTLWVCPCHIGDDTKLEEGTRLFPGSFEEPVPECGGKKPNDLIREGRWIELEKPQPEDNLFEYSYAGYCAATNHKRGWAGSMRYALGHEGQGVCFSSGYGDGCYPVFARYNSEGRVAEVRIKMIDDEDRHPYDDGFDMDA